MGKIKLIVKLSIVNLLIVSGLFVSPVKAAAPTVSINPDLPGYINNNTFKLYYSASPADPSITAQFYVKKEGSSFVAFGPVLNGASGQVQVTSTQVNDQVDYCFKVEINSGASDETCSTYDVSGPSPIQSYWKEKLTPESYRLHWKNPWDSDYSRVLIYRGTEAGFTADGSHKVGEVGGTHDADMSWDNFGLDAAIEYYYALRAVDAAGNSASLVGDAPVVLQTVAGTTTYGTESKVAVIPSEEPKAENVLPATTEVGETPTLAQQAPQNAPSETTEASKMTSRGIIIGIITAFALASGLYYLYLKRNR